MPALPASQLPGDLLRPSHTGAGRGTRGSTLPQPGSAWPMWDSGNQLRVASRTQGHSSETIASLWHRGAEPPWEQGSAAEGSDPAPSSRGTMAPGRGDTSRTRGTAGTCAATQAALCKATAGHRQLVLQLGGSADSPRLREERRRRSAEARELSAGLRRALLGGLRQAAASPEERRELERLWVLFLSALELFLQDLHRAHHLCQLFSRQGGGTAPLCTGLAGRRGGVLMQPPATPDLEEEIEQVRATLAEMESRANIPLWAVEATQPAGTSGTAAGVAQGGPHMRHCCRVL
ncbi:regulator of G-protein signaling 9-binding protein-like [Apus apus]|uniref:regulator of G-protein signaling 9-binding protein-like n=1 Tax=Apus apus TaxID=8895 RepID=UPI0021F8581B|nr:regulator of G-protein signaling 9-binding protein-like [Apus apus]